MRERRQDWRTAALVVVATGAAFAAGVVLGSRSADGPTPPFPSEWRRMDGAVESVVSRREAEVRKTPSPVAPMPTSVSRAPSPSAKLDLNRAGKSDLIRLPGIGEARAEAIIALREKKGRFERVEDLLEVKGIGPKILEKIRPQVTVVP
ncbi:MAG: hypothetical protein BLM47_13710 [Candidatus Reconcilbacillus cellulovorans]|uniref:Helix-hairpin-helix DNA-binding motif class 1 domain-containing protein n=1 Tax=Candidatus Reconcilbacillus cellulovorans TaxID=1906605 RepID=A0A2A6DWG7_9BACL|nr:MAG: hypothetical protein BLM47_13710 [Candidatus Reconcilbacillus cellulovorans]